MKTDDQGLKCEYCGYWFHDDCQGVDQIRYDAISKSGDQTHWFCNICNLKVMDTLRFIQTVKDDNEAIKAELTNIKTQVNDLASKFESDISSKPSHDEVAQMIDDRVLKVQANNDQAQASQQMPQVVSSVLSEIDQRKNRQSNIIIHGVDECKSVNSETRIEYDTQKVREILQVCEISQDASTITRVYRPGKYDKDKGRRPLIATLNNPDLKKEIFKNAGKLRESDHDLKDVRIGNDLTKTEREQEKKLYEK